MYARLKKIQIETDVGFFYKQMNIPLKCLQLRLHPPNAWKPENGIDCELTHAQHRLCSS